ncbi:MAG: NHL repeat-containing protein [Candidatus Riflebacteria bacterium]|nr:NHL repeat-containing protein [Candidatus Riflebacteria bacterium]
MVPVARAAAPEPDRSPVQVQVVGRSVSLAVQVAGHGMAEVQLRRGEAGEASRQHRHLFRVAPGPNRFTAAVPAAPTAEPLLFKVVLRLSAYVAGPAFGSLGRGEEQFTHPQSIAIGSGGKLYVVDSGNDRVQVLSDRHTYLFEFGGFTFDTSGRLPESESQRFDEPVDAVFSINRDLYVTDRNNNRVLRLDRDGRFLSSFGPSAGLRLPRGLAANSLGEVLVADTENDRILVFDRDGRQQKQIGTFGWGDRQLRNPFDVTVDQANNVWVADTLNNRVQGFDQFGRLIGIIAGGFEHPMAVRADRDGFGWVVDGRRRQLFKFTPAGRLAAGRRPGVRG